MSTVFMYPLARHVSSKRSRRPSPRDRKRCPGAHQEEQLLTRLPGRFATRRKQCEVRMLDVSQARPDRIPNSTSAGPARALLPDRAFRTDPVGADSSDGEVGCSEGERRGLQRFHGPVQSSSPGRHSKASAQKQHLALRALRRSPTPFVQVRLRHSVGAPRHLVRGSCHGT